MDVLQDYLPTFYNLYSTYYSPYEAYLRPFLRYIYLTQSYAYRYLFPVLYPIYRLTVYILSRALADKPDLASLVLLAVLLLVSLKLLDMLRRQVVYWISLALRFALWAGVLLVGFYVYQRGVEQSLEDVGWLIGFVAELGEQGEKIGQRKAEGRRADAKRAGYSGSRGRARRGGWG